MKIEFHAIQREDSVHLVACLENDDPVTHGILVQKGFIEGQEAMQALVEAITTAVPDISSLEAGVASISDLAVRLDDAESAIRTVGERLNIAEDRLDGIAFTPAAGRSPLLPGRDTGQQQHTPQPPVRQPPAIRRTKDKPEPEQDLPARVHGQLFGGVSRGRHSEG